MVAMLLDQKDKEIMYIAFLECKLKGSWMSAAGPSITPLNTSSPTVDILTRAMNDDCSVELIVLDGLRRTLQFSQGDMIDISSNVIIYNNQNVDEITVDEKEQSGNGRSREHLE